MPSGHSGVKNVSSSRANIAPDLSHTYLLSSDETSYILLISTINTTTVISIRITAAAIPAFL